MLLNFCDPCLRPEIKCSTVCTEGHEETNLINGSGKGFLAYSCIKPPVHIDIKFACNIQINHILIWPSVGSQKSTGFRFYTTSNDDDTSYTLLLSNSYLTPTQHAGLWLDCMTNVDDNIPVPVLFLRCRIMSARSYVATHVRSLRVTICKTCNSVPALGKIEVWGTVSRRCDSNFTANIHCLWLSRNIESAVVERKADDNPTSVTDNRQKDKAPREISHEASLDIPESFLDCITWELMTQPIILPSGNMIDVTTLEKHKKHEENWGRPLSDPFTGLPFNNVRKPIILTSLKMRIDRFLQEYSNLDEIKRMPRVLGRNPTSAMAGDRRLFEVPRCVSNTRSLKRTAEDASNVFKQAINNDAQQRKEIRHQLPVAVVSRESTANIRLKKQTVKMPGPFPLSRNNPRICDKDDKSEIAAIDIDVSLDNSTGTSLPKIKRFNTPEKVELSIGECECCDNSILYRLPCKHVICRKILLSIENNQCKSCGIFYKWCDVERIHVHISTK